MMDSFDLNGRSKKAFHVIVSAFFCVLLLSVFPAYSIEPCTLKGASESVQWDYIADGDTLWLKDGRKIRFPSINTPEIAHEQKPAEPFGDEADLTLRQLFSGSRKMKVQVVGKDHHGRVLAHPFLMDGRSIESLLIEQGLGYQLFSEEQDPYRDCLRQQEAQARKKKIGIWSKKTVFDIRADRLKPGFQLLRGEVVKVSSPKKSDFFWVEMDGPVVIRIPKSSVEASWLKTLMGKRIEFRGWLVDRKNKNKGGRQYKRWMIGIYSQDGIQRL